MESTITLVIKENFPKVKSVTTRKRGKNLYMTIKLNTFTMDGYHYLTRIKTALTGYFPNVYITSGSNDQMTFRLNGKYWLTFL